jgi:glutamine synthetase
MLAQPGRSRRAGNGWASALDELEKDEVVKAALGEHILENYLRAKRRESGSRSGT